jgi:hypothetical protein
LESNIYFEKNTAKHLSLGYLSGIAGFCFRANCRKSSDACAQRFKRKNRPARRFQRQSRFAEFLGDVVCAVLELVKWQTEYQTQGLQIIGITYPPTSRTETRNFVRQNKINYPILLGSKKTKELFDSTETMPYSVVIDKNGNVAARIEGIIYADEFDEKIKPLLESKRKIDVK